MEEASAEVEKIRLLAESRMDPAGMESLRQELTELSAIVAKQKEEVAEYQAKLDAAESLLSEGNWDKDKELEKLRWGIFSSISHRISFIKAVFAYLQS